LVTYLLLVPNQKSKFEDSADVVQVVKSKQQCVAFVYISIILKMFASKIRSVLVGAAIFANFALGHKWDYPKPDARGVLPDEDWGEECNNGARQSPIDLTRLAAVKGYYPRFTFEDYDDEVENCSVTNNGHSIQINAHPDQEMLVLGGGLPGTYQFDQVHFHWGSEHTIEGERFALEAHLVHHEVRFDNLGEAAAVSKGLAVLGVLFHVAPKPNPVIERVLIASEGVKQHVGRSQLMTNPIRLEELLPADKTAYFRYDGSLTTPGCGEAVVWTVFIESLPISLDQVERFKAIHTHDGRQLTHNFRGTKPLNARALVYVSEEEARRAANIIGGAEGVTFGSSLFIAVLFSTYNLLF